MMEKKLKNNDVGYQKGGETVGELNKATGNSGVVRDTIRGFSGGD